MGTVTEAMAADGGREYREMTVWRESVRGWRVEM